MKRRMAVAIMRLFALYVAGYVCFRQSHLQVWERDGQNYVIFPSGNPSLYYFFRPLAYLDGKLTGVCFHIGPHR